MKGFTLTSTISLIHFQIVVLAGVAMAGLVASVLSFGYLQRRYARGEAEVRNFAHKNVMMQLRKWTRTSDFKDFVRTSFKKSYCPT